MRTRLLVIATILTLIAGIAGVTMSGRFASAQVAFPTFTPTVAADTSASSPVADESAASPESAELSPTEAAVVVTPAATPTTAPEPTEATTDAATPEASPGANQQIVTLVAWYSSDETNDVLTLSPVETNAKYEASQGTVSGDILTGTVNFTESRNKGGLPRIVLGKSIFDAVELTDGDRSSVERWFYYNDEDGTRPATLVMQIVAKEGPYQDATGTATFISRANDSTGVLVIVLYLPAS